MSSIIQATAYASPADFGECESFLADSLEQGIVCGRRGEFVVTVWAELPDGTAVRLAGSSLCSTHALLAGIGTSASSVQAGPVATPQR